MGNEKKKQNIDLNDIKDFLGYSDDFWEYITDKTKTIEKPYDNYDIKMSFYGIWYEIENNSIKKLKICIPEVIDLKTAQIALHEIKHAHDIYTNNFDLSIEEYEKSAREEEKKFEKEYVLKHHIL